MSSDNPERRLADIVENADSIASYLGEMDAADFIANQLVVDARERCLERIVEAVVKIGDERMISIAPDLPVQRVRGLGNMLRHAYDQIDLRSLYYLMTTEVPRLRDACAAGLRLA